MEKNSENPPPPSSSDPPPPSSSTAGAGAAKSESTHNHQIQSALKSLNKSSFKISKPSSRPCSSLPPPSLPPPSSSESSMAALPPAPPQPPVYNIDKNNFREIVQKLTGSPAPVPAPVPPRPAAPVPPPPEVTTSTPRLHRIRPPPLANLSTFPPQMGSQSHTSLSPLPPLPTVGITAESPVSAYLRRLQGGAGADLALPPSPLGFGCLPAVPSPRTASYMMMMSNVGMPTSPGVPAPSPREGR
ncbi:hypothetical protein LUZ60_005727 [Juncus effusus]|nr:hypothetical protein LUZ60_005727 [Juncus effusus]